MRSTLRRGRDTIASPLVTTERDPPYQPVGHDGLALPNRNPKGPSPHGTLHAFAAGLPRVRRVLRRPLGGRLLGRPEGTHRAEDYFLAGRTLPWYVVGSSFIASNISTEHFIGMIGAAFVYGICVAMTEWGNVLSFSVLIWLFIPFLLASRVFTTPEFMEKRFHPLLRQLFAVLTIISNVVAFLAAVLYGGGLALQSLFGWGLWFSIIALAIVAGSGRFTAVCDRWRGPISLP